MKPTYSRRYRRRVTPSRDPSIFKKDGPQEQPFFSPASQQSFFKPNMAVMRKCDHCQGEDKKASRVGETKDDEKKVSRAAEIKEEKEVKRMSGPKEEEKKVSRAADMKEEKEIKRMEGPKEEEKKVSRAEEEKDKKLSKKEEAASTARVDSASDYIQTLNGKGQPLPEESQAFFQERMNYDFDHVRIHTDANAQQSAKDINAKAYAVDNNIVFNKGQYNPSSDEGKKLLAHELAHVIQNDPGTTVRKKAQHPEEEKELNISISGTSNKAKGKKAMGGCNIPDVHGETTFTPLPSSFRVKGAKNRTSTECETCVAPDCITSRGTIVSTFKSNIHVALPSVPSGLTPCEAAAVRRFIRTTLSSHEQEHVSAFRTYNGTVNTPYEFTGCRADLKAYIQDIHNNIESQRSADANAQSDALDPFVEPIPCDCD